MKVGLIGFLLGLAGCGGGGNGQSTPTASTASVATRDVTVLEDDRCYHLGDEIRTDLCGPSVSNLGAPERRWTFTVTSQPLEGRLALHVVDLGPIGAEVHLNGRAINMPLPLGEGSGTGTVPGMPSESARTSS